MIDPKSALHRFLLAVIACPFVASCSAAPPAESRDDEATSASTALASSGATVCPEASTAVVLAPLGSPEAACAPVAGRGGAWATTTREPPVTCTGLTSDADDLELCVYQWTATKQAPPDVAALQALPGVDVAVLGDDGVPACTQEATLRFGTLLNLAQVSCPFKAGGGGNAPKGCDICGKKIPPGVIWGTLYLPASTGLHTFVVPMSNGSKQAISIADGAPTATRARGGASSFLEVPLPRLPRGVRWVDGPVLGYGDLPASP